MTAEPGARVGYLDGAWRTATAGSRSWKAVNPATAQPFAELHSASPQDVADAVACASRAFQPGSPWRELPDEARADLLRRLAAEIRSRGDELAHTMTDETGTPISLSTGSGVTVASDTLEWFAGAAVRGPYGSYEHPVARDTGASPTEGLNRYEPVGVVAAIVPYNFPLNMLAWKVGAAVAAGCTVVVLPSPRGSLTTVAFFEALEAAGFPPGVVNLVLGGADVGAALTTHEGVALISFTGSVPVGQQIMAGAAGRLTRVVLELGGKNPNILLPSVDIESAARAAVLRFSANAGQMCGATTRIFVPSALHDDVVEACIAAVGELNVVDPHDPVTIVGPLISGEHRARSEDFVDRGRSAGGAVVVGGDRPDAEGFYLNPTLLTGLANDAELNQEELFAPVASVLPYDDLDEAVALANASRYGLNATVYGDHDEAVALARRLRVGTVSINSPGTRRPDVPWGGFGMSGIGRELGDLGFSQFFELQHVQWQSAP